MTITLMQEFDRLAGDVVVIAATNRLDLLDEAFISRCPLRYEMTPFSYEERKEMVNCFLADIGMEFSDEEKEPIIAKDEDQRSIIGSLIRKIAEKLDTEERD
jgi:SpoVK/Ycf46/Vps4 family AAA+-type ATPase